MYEPSIGKIYTLVVAERQPDKQRRGLEYQLSYPGSNELYGNGEWILGSELQDVGALGQTQVQGQETKRCVVS